jgi:hypothetical protein
MKVVTVTALVAVLTWSAVMAVLGQVAAVTALLPSFGLLLQQIVQALSSPDGPHPAARRPFRAGGGEKVRCVDVVAAPFPRPSPKRGRKPAPISESVGLSHRAWLEPVRSTLSASGLTLNDLADRSGYSKTRISELLRGNGYYPAWEITFSVVRVLGIPASPMYRLWSAAAREANKETDWIRQCISTAR